VQGAKSDGQSNNQLQVPSPANSQKHPGKPVLKACISRKDLINYSKVASGKVAGQASIGSAGFGRSCGRRLPGSSLAERKGKNEKKSLHAN
jgi:hypothetical protein